MVELTGTWRGRPGRLVLDGATVSFVESDGRRPLVLEVTEAGPEASAEGALLRLGDSEIVVDDPDAAASAAEFAAEVREAVRRHVAAPSGDPAGPVVTLGRILALVGAVLVVVGTWAGWALADEFGTSSFTGLDGVAEVETSLAQRISFFSSGALLFWLTGIASIVGGFVLERLDALDRGR